MTKTAIPCILTKDFKIHEAKTDGNKKRKRKSHNYHREHEHLSPGN